MVRVFNQSERGLFYMDRSGAAEGVTLVNTVANNKSSYTNCNYSRAVLARQIQKTIGRPSTQSFIAIVEQNLLPNCPTFWQQNTYLARTLGHCKGKLFNTRLKGFTVDIPDTIMSRYRNVILAGDIMFVNKIIFFVTVSWYLRFGTVEMILNWSNKTVLTAMKQVKSAYMQRGFILSTLLMDGKFEPLCGKLADMQITLNTVSNDKHVPDVERYIRTVKERTRCIYNTLPFKQFPACMIIEMVYASNFWLNCFPPADGISTTLSPRAIVLGTSIDYNKHCQLEFGTYAHVHEDHDHTMATRTTGAIALHPVGNEQGGYYFFSLASGRVLNRNHWTVPPMPADVINRVHVLARRSGANGLHFTDQEDGQPLLNFADANDDDNDDNDYESYQSSEGSDSYDDDPDNLSFNDDDNNDDDNNDDNDDDLVQPAGVYQVAEPAGVYANAGLPDNGPIAGVYDANPQGIQENPKGVQENPEGVQENPEQQNPEQQNIVAPEAQNDDNEVVAEVALYRRYRYDVKVK
jgi:hypothetical protein